MGNRRHCEECGQEVFEDRWHGELHDCPALRRCERCGDSLPEDELWQGICVACEKDQKEESEYKFEHGQEEGPKNV